MSAMAIFRHLSLSPGYKIESMHHDNGQLRKTAEYRFVSEPSPVIEDRFQRSRSALRACSLSLGSNRVVAPMVSKATRISAPTRRRYGKSKEGCFERAQQTHVSPTGRRAERRKLTAPPKLPFGSKGTRRLRPAVPYFTSVSAMGIFH